MFLSAYGVVEVASERESKERDEHIHVISHVLNCHVVIAAWDDRADLPRGARRVRVCGLSELLRSEHNRTRWTAIARHIVSFLVEDAAKRLVKRRGYKLRQSLSLSS